MPIRTLKRCAGLRNRSISLLATPCSLDNLEDKVKRKNNTKVTNPQNTSGLGSKDVGSWAILWGLFTAVFILPDILELKC